MLCGQRRAPSLQKREFDRLPRANQPLRSHREIVGSLDDSAVASANFDEVVATIAFRVFERTDQKSVSGPRVVNIGPFRRPVSLQIPEGINEGDGGDVAFRRIVHRVI